MNKYLTIILLVTAIQINAQDIQKKIDVRFGVGVSLLGTGDMTTINFENEVNYKLNKNFATSLTLNYGKSISGIYQSSSYIQGNVNIFFSPFKNSRKNDFRIGTGFSIMNISDSCYWEQSSPYHYNKRNSSGFNIIIEDTYLVTKKMLIGLKLFNQPYLNGDINSGILLKCGFKL